MNPPFVKKFDFRGIYPNDISDKDAFFLSLAIQQVLPLKKVLVGWDSRVSSEHMAYNFMEAFSGSQTHVMFLEKCPIDYVTAGANAFDFDFSVMFTGSHNPWNWTGLLMHTNGGESVQGELVSKIVKAYYEVQTVAYREPKVDLLNFEDFQTTIEKTYIERIASLIPLDKIKPFTVLVDIGDGTGSKSLSLLSRTLSQVTFQRINDREVYDEHSSHTADPSNIENMRELMNAVAKGTYDCGVAFDSDSDRVLAVDENGKYLNGSLIGSAMIENFVNLGNSMQKFGYAVDCGPAFYNTCLDLKKLQQSIEVNAVPVGRSILRQMIRDHKVDLAIENVGHFYVRDFFQTDSGVFSLVCLLYWMSVHGKLSSLAALHPDGYREQFTKPVEEDVSQQQKKYLENVFNNYTKKVITVDGLREEYFAGEKLVHWFAKRRSGYEKIEKYYFGSLNSNDFEIITEEIKKENHD